MVESSVFADTSLRAAGIFFCFLPEGMLCKTEDKALEGDL